MPKGYPCVNSAHTRVNTCRGTSYCRDCMLKSQRERRQADPEYTRKHHLKSLYGMTPEHYAALLHEQSGRCAICDQPETRQFGGIVTPLCVDHDHASGRVRALLCNQCNVLLGQIEKDRERIHKMDRYIKAHAE